MRTPQRFCIFLMGLFLPIVASGFDDTINRFNLDLLYHYSRIERSTLVQTHNFQSRQGGMLQFEYEDEIDLFWRWYVGGDFTFARYEASATTQFSPQERMPWQAYIGTGFQIGALKSWEIFFGAGGSSEHYFVGTGVNQFDFRQTASLRGHLGLSWRFLSMTGASAKLLFRYSLPLTQVNHNGAEMTYRGILDGNIRLRHRYDSSFSFYGGIRFEDYKLMDESITYFTSRVYAGLGLHFQ